MTAMLKFSFAQNYLRSADLWGPFPVCTKQANYMPTNKLLILLNSLFQFCLLTEFTSTSAAIFVENSAEPCRPIAASDRSPNELHGGQAHRP
jgi:hypothetical protein